MTTRMIICAALALCALGCDASLTVDKTQAETQPETINKTTLEILEADTPEVALISAQTKIFIDGMT